MKKTSSVSFRWKKKTPTRPGWYWFRTKKVGPQIVEIVEAEYRLLIQIRHNYPEVSFVDLEGVGGQWAGPVPEPEE